MKQNELDSLLKNIELTGSVSVESSGVVYINKAIENITDRSSGKIRITPARINQFSLILSQPSQLSALSPLEIRCLSCGRVISYPSWWSEVKFDKNTFHYFVCFSQISPSRVKLGLCSVNISKFK